MVTEVGATVTEAKGTSVTVTVTVADADPLRAVIVADPIATAVTSPALETAAVGSLDDDQVTGVVSVAPLALRGVAVSCAVLPGFRSRAAGVTSMDAGDAGLGSLAAGADEQPQHHGNAHGR